MKTEGFKKVAIYACVIAFLFANPYTRMFILWLLPLGSGIDDLVEIIAIIIAIVFGVYYYIRRKRNA